MRIAIYSHNYWPEPTGIPFYNTGMCRWLARRKGWQVTIRTGMPHYPWWKVPETYADRDYRHGGGDEVVDGVHIERVRHFVPAPPPSCLARMHLDLSWLLAIAWRSLHTRDRPDVVVLIAPPFLIGILGLWLRLRWRVPVVYHVQDLQVDAAVELHMMPACLATVLLATERLILGNLDQVTTISPAMRSQLVAKTGARRSVALFPNWVDARHMRAWVGPNRFRAAWNLGPESLVAMYAGNIGRKQGLEVLIEAAALLQSNVTVVIAGAGGEREVLEQLATRIAPGRIRFCDLVDASELAEFLSAADIHCVIQRPAVAGAVMPSKLLNIMAVSRPVVVTALPGTDLAFAVDAASAGRVVRPDDAIALACAITDLANDQPGRASAGASARAWVVGNFGIDRILGQFAARLRMLAARGDGAHGSTTMRTRWTQAPPLDSNAIRRQRTGADAILGIPVTSAAVTAPSASPSQLITTLPVPALNRADTGPMAMSTPGPATSSGRLIIGPSRPSKVAVAVSTTPPSSIP